MNLRKMEIHCFVDMSQSLSSILNQLKSLLVLTYYFLETHFIMFYL